MPPRPPPAAWAPCPRRVGAAHAAVILVAALAAAGCGRTVTEDDCRKIGDTLQQAWQAEAKKATPLEGTGAEKAAGVLKAEEERLVSEWAAECKREIQDRRVDAKEMDCLLASKTLEQVTRCSKP